MILLMEFRRIDASSGGHFSRDCLQYDTVAGICVFYDMICVCGQMGVLL